VGKSVVDGRGARIAGISEFDAGRQGGHPRLVGRQQRHAGDQNAKYLDHQYILSFVIFANFSQQTRLQDISGQPGHHRNNAQAHKRRQKAQSERSGDQDPGPLGGSRGRVCGGVARLVGQVGDTVGQRRARGRRTPGLRQA
jgi:hypothetical protein